MHLAGSALASALRDPARLAADFRGRQALRDGWHRAAGVSSAAGGEGSILRHPFADHHAFTPAVALPDGDVILMTEEGCGKMRAFRRRELVWPVRAQLAPERRRTDCGEARWIPDCLKSSFARSPRAPRLPQGQAGAVERSARLAYPIRDGIPVMLEGASARAEEELAQAR